MPSPTCLVTPPRRARHDQSTFDPTEPHPGEMEALKVYNSDESDSDAEGGSQPASNCSVLDSIQTRKSVGMKRKPVTGYVSRRKSARPEQQEPSSMSSTFSGDISSYLSSPSAKRDHKSMRCVLPESTPYATFSLHSKPVLGLHWHPSDDRLLLSCSLDGTVRLWDTLWQKMCIATYTVQDVPMKTAAWVTSTAVICAGYDNCAFHADVVSGRILSRLKHDDYVTAVAVHPEDSNSLLTGSSRSEILRWDLRCCKEVSRYKGAGGQILDILFLKGGGQFVASSDIERKGSYGQTMTIWDYASGVALATQVYFEPYSCLCLRLHPTESVFLAQSNANYLIMFSSNKPYKMNKFKRFEGHVLDGYRVGFDVSNDGSIVCSASANGAVVFYDYSSTRTLISLPLATSSTLGVEWHPRLPSVVAVSSWNGHIFCLK